MKQRSAVLSLCAASMFILTACPPPNDTTVPLPSSEPLASPSPNTNPSPLPSSTPKPSTNPETPIQTPDPTASGTLPNTTPSGAPEVDVAQIASIEISATNRFLNTGKGAKTQITALLKDSDGNTVSLKDAVLEWTSSRPSDFGIDANGLATALVDEGFTVITVTETRSGVSASIQLSVSDSSQSSGGGGGGGGGGKTTTPSLENLALNLRFNDLGRREFLVDTFSSSSSTFSFSGSAVAADDAGNFVTVWAGDGEIYGQRYTSKGSPLGPKFRVNDQTLYTQSMPSVAMDDDGDFVVAWMSDEDGASDYFDIHAQRFDNNGDRAGLEWRVNNDTSFDQTKPSVALDADGDFVIAWSSSPFANNSGSGFIIGGDIHAKRYNASGAMQSEFMVFTMSTSSSAGGWPTVAMDDTGDFVITWSEIYGSKYNNAIVGQRYNSSNIEQGSEFVVYSSSTTSEFGFFPDVAMDDTGDFVVSWSHLGYSEGGYGFITAAQRYNASGIAQGSEIPVKVGSSSDAGFISSIAMDDDGDFVVSWADKYGDVKAQRFDSSGVAQNGEILVSASQSSTYIGGWTDVAMDAAGDFVINWSTYGVSNLRIFNAAGQGR